MDVFFHDLRDEKFDAIVKRYLGIVANGLPASDQAKQTVLILGAGMAGLVAGTLLKDAGHTVHIIEASNRVGGRIKTFRDEFSGEHYGEAGAMRMPDHHQLLQAYIQKYNLPRKPFFNVEVDPATINDPVPRKRNNTYLYINGVKTRIKDYLAEKTTLNYPLAPGEQGKTAQELLHGAITPLIEFIKTDEENHWPIVMQRYGEYSVRDFFKQQTYLSEPAIELMGVVLNIESRMMTSFIQTLIEFSNINADVSYWEIPGGSDLIPRAFEPGLQDNIIFNNRVKAIQWQADGQGQATVHTTDGDTMVGDQVIVTIPFSGLRFVDFEPLLPYTKRKAIRELHYDSSTKVLLEFSRRFWELDDDIYGGGTVTDLANRFMYYPSHNIGSEQGGVVLASYTWADDAVRWDSLPAEMRYQFALDGMAKIHGEQIRQYFVGGATQSWVQDPYAYGEAAIFSPGQLELLHPHIQQSHGNVHFAGEHTSIKHAWIEGAIESGIRTALEVNGNPIPDSTITPQAPI